MQPRYYRQDLNTAIKIFEHLRACDRNGKLAMSIGRELGIPASKVREILATLPRTFLKVGDTNRYTINRFKPTTVRSLTDEYRKMIQEKNSDALSRFTGIARAATDWLS